MMSRRRGRGARRRSMLIAIATIVVTAIGAYLIFTKDIPFTRPYEIEAIVGNSNQLRAGSPVRIAGVDVGKIQRVEDGPGDTQVLVLAVSERGRPIHKDARLRIRPRLFLEGGFYVDLNPGSASGPELGDGDSIPLANTSNPVQIHQVLQMLNRPTRESFRSLLSEFETALDRGGAEGLNRLQKPLAPALRDSAVVLDAARGTHVGDLPALIRNNARVVKALADSDTALASSITNLNRTSSALAAERAALSEGLRQLDGVFDELPPALDALDRALPAVRRFNAAVEPITEIAPPILRRTGDLLVQTQLLTSSRNLPRLARELRPTLNALPTLTRRLRTLLPLVEPVADCVRDRVNPVLRAKLDDGPLSTGQPVYQNLLSTSVGLASASSSFDANGYAVRYLLGAGANSLSAGSVNSDEILGGLLSGSTEQPILGSRPQPLPPGTQPPFKSDEECRDQTPPNLVAKTGPAPAQGAVDRSRLRGFAGRSGLSRSTRATLRADLAEALTSAGKDGE